MEERAEVPVWEWEFRGCWLQLLQHVCVCIGQVAGKVKNSSSEQGCRTQDSCHPTSTWLGVSQTRRLTEGFALWILPFHVALEGEGDVLWETLLWGPPGSSHPYRLRRANDGDFCHWEQNLTLSSVCGDVWQVNGTLPALQRAAAHQQLWWHLIPLKTSHASDNTHSSEAFKVFLALCSTTEIILCANQLQLVIPIGLPKIREAPWGTSALFPQCWKDSLWEETSFLSSKPLLLQFNSILVLSV